MFLGDFQHTLDAKGRVSLPARFRSETGGRLVIVRGFEGCLWVYPAEEYAAFIDELTSRSDFDPRVRRVRRFFTSGAIEVEPDKAGRIMIPPVLREHAGLKRDVSVTGNGPRIEIWDTETWSAYLSDTASGIEEDAAQLSELEFF